MKKVVSLTMAVMTAVVLLSIHTAFADVNDFTITNFVGDYTLTNQDPQGGLHVVEQIDVVFRDFNHGILRAIPATYKKHKLQLHVNNISSTTNAPSQFTTSS